MVNSFNTLLSWPKNQVTTQFLASNKLPLTQRSTEPPFIQSHSSIDSAQTGSDSSISDLDLEHGRKQKFLGRSCLFTATTLKLQRWRDIDWKPSRKHIFILLSINIIFMIGVLYVTFSHFWSSIPIRYIIEVNTYLRIWFALLVSFIHRIARPPTHSNGITRLINNITSSTSALSHLQSYETLPADFTRGIRPIACHSHNDYWRHIPLLDAISAGCTSVEVDIWVSGQNSQANNKSELYIGHHSSALRSERTFRQLYLQPLVYILDEINKSNPKDALSTQTIQQATGIYDASPNTTLVLLLDFKNSASKTDIWTAVQEHLQPLREMSYLTYWNGTSKERVLGPITVVATGEAPFDLINDSKSNPSHDVFFDAPLNQLSSTVSSPYTMANSYYASVSLSKAVGKVWLGLTSSQLRTVELQVKNAEDIGLLSRYWDTPAWPLNVRNGIWKQLVQKSVGVLNVDELWTVSARDWRICWSVGWGICA